MTKQSSHIIFLIFFAVMLVACDSGDHYAPVEDIAPIQPIPRSGIHVVQKGDSLYSIAWRYGKDYQQLEKINHLRSPYRLRAGQVIRLRAVNLTEQPYQPVTRHDEIIEKPSSSSSYVPQSNNMAANWIWPAEGRVIKKYSDLNKGINIQGTLGSPVYAASAGQVVYSGNGLRGYGNLIIIKHNSQYLSAYAHNKNMYVKEGQWVRQGQKIAAMGQTSRGDVMLHFEIRYLGRPIDPLSVLTQGNS